jgi:ABC-type spermidine/putrescine transport system permease subunit II
VLSFLKRDPDGYGVIWQFTLENYQKLFDANYARVFGNTILLGIKTTALCVLLGYPFGYFMGRASKKWRTILMLLVMIVLLGVMLVIAVVYSVFTYIALFDLFRSCNPDTGVLFLILSIVLGINGFFVFLDRNKDLGMPVVDDGFEALEPAEE